MCSKDNNPYRSPQVPAAPTELSSSSQSYASFCGQAKIVLCCLSVHPFVWARYHFTQIRPDWFDGFVAVLAVVSTVAGIACGVSAIRHQGLANRWAGVFGLLYFGFYVLLAIAES